MIFTQYEQKESAKKLESVLGQEISELNVDHYMLKLSFTNGSTISFFDQGNDCQCCEQRYMSSDNKLEDYVGATLIGAEISNGFEQEEHYTIHETQFLAIKTSAGKLILQNHVEHNGYRGEFDIVAV